MKKFPITSAKTLADWAFLAIEKHFQKTINHEADVLKDNDAEALHQMRVGMRRLRSSLTGFSLALDMPKAVSEKKIGKIAGTLGSLRDLDVLMEALENNYKPLLPEIERENLDTVLEELGYQRREVFKIVEDTLHSKNYKKLKRSLKNWLKNPVYQPVAKWPIQSVVADLLLPQISQLFLHPGWLVGMTVTPTHIESFNHFQLKDIEQELNTSEPVLHSLRKQVKRVRYLMTMFGEIYSENYAGYVNDMKAIQEVLGHLQDTAVLAEMLGEILDKDIKIILPTLAQQLGQSRLEAWQKWQPLQQRYLSSETRLAFHSEILHPLPTNSTDEFLYAGEPVADGANFN